MLKYLEKIFLFTAVVSLAFSAQAKVTPVHEYKAGMIASGDDSTATCAQYGEGWYDTKKGSANAVVETKTIPNTTTKCYKTTCPSNFVFSPSNCNQTGFTKGSSSCTDSLSKTYYTDCPCASGYYTADKFASNYKTAFTMASGTEVTITAERLTSSKATCYKLAGFTCKSGTVSVTDKPSISGGAGTITRLGGFAKYNVITPLSSASTGVVCAKDVTFSSPLTEGSVPSNTLKCAEITKDQKDPVLGKTYWYYNGNCSTASDTSCGSTSDVCISTTYTTPTVFTSSQTKSTVNCYYATGCKYTSNTDGSICAGPKGTPSVSTSYFAASSASVGTVSCQKVTGCATSNGYEKVFSGAYLPKVSSEYASDEKATYDVQTVIASSDSSVTADIASMVCRKQTGCNTNNGYYNVACDGGCWDGWLSLWGGFGTEAIPCVAGAWVDTGTGACYASADTGHDQYMYLDTNYNVDLGPLARVIGLKSYTETTSLTASCGTGATPLTLSDLQTLAATANFRNAIYAPNCIVASGTGKIYNVSASGAVVQANTSEEQYIKDSASGGCIIKIQTSLEQTPIMNNIYQSDTYAFAAVNTDIVQDQLLCICQTDDLTTGKCTSCPAGCTLQVDGKCVEQSSVTLCLQSNCTTCASSSACSVCATGYTLKSGNCCPANCTACNALSTCTTCASGYTLSGGECTKTEGTTISLNGSFQSICKVAR